MSIFNIYRVILILLVAIFALNLESRSAVVLEQISYMQDNPDRKGKGTIYISDNRIKFTDNVSNSVVIFDIESNKVLKIDNESKTYAVSTPEKYISSVYEQWLIEKQKLKMDVSNLPKDKRDYQVNILKSRGIDLYGEEKPLNLSIVDTGENVTLADHTAKSFKVYRDKTLIEEYWLSNNIDELDYQKFAKFYSNMQRITNIIYLDSEKPETITNTLKSMFVNGFPLKSVDYQTRGNRVEEITKIGNIELTKQDFVPPTGYKEVSFE